MSAPKLKRKQASDFTLPWLLDVLVSAKLLTASQSKDIATREPQARARVVKISGEERYQPTPVELVAAFQVQLPTGQTLDQDLITEAAASAAGIPYRKIDLLKLGVDIAGRSFSQPYARKHSILPLEGGGVMSPLTVAVANPFDQELFEGLTRIVGSAVVPVLSARADILRGIADVYDFKRTVVAAAHEHAEGGPGIGNFEQLISVSANQQLDAGDRPVIQAVDYLLRYAFDQRASDIHLEAKRERCVVRLRIDGVLHSVYELPVQLHAPIIARIKTISRLDIAEKRKPQDGRIKVERDGREIEIRVSTLPTAFGEKAVLRIFDPETAVVDLGELGFDATEKKLFESWIQEPHGLILVTGPTGSGKTTTLYSALKVLSGPDVNVTTIEDPIEMVWEAFNQVQVQPRIGLDFATALRHILRQDPDIIMVGEIRDGETAENAIQSALTGHLVLSTLHTNDSVGAVSRMRDLDVPAFLLSSCLLGIMAQRLLRRVCVDCAAPTTYAESELASLSVPIPDLPGGPKFLKGKGCVKCRGTGYRGRTAVFEMFSGTESVKQLVANGGSYGDLVAAGRRSGFRTLREAATLKLAQGVTGLDEVLRMTTIEQT